MTSLALVLVYGLGNEMRPVRSAITSTLRGGGGRETHVAEVN